MLNETTKKLKLGERKPKKANKYFKLIEKLLIDFIAHFSDPKYFVVNLNIFQPISFIFSLRSITKRSYRFKPLRLAIELFC